MRERMMSVMLTVNRVLLGAFMLLAGYSKFHMGMDKFYAMYQGMAPTWLPKWFVAPYGYAVPYLEVLVGGLLIVGLMTRLTALVTALMITSFTIALAGVMTSGNVFNLGGQAPIHSNYFFIALALLLACAGAGCCSVDGLLGKGGKSRSVPKKT